MSIAGQVPLSWPNHRPHAGERMPIEGDIAMIAKRATAPLTACVAASGPPARPTAMSGRPAPARACQVTTVRPGGARGHRAVAGG